MIGNTDTTVRQMLALLNREGKNLTKMRNQYNGCWTILEREYTFTTTASEDEYALPDDFGDLLGDTVWDRDSFFEVRGPLAPAEWQAVKSGLAVTPSLRRRFRIKRIADFSDNTRKFNIDPEPTATGETLVFEYCSKEWTSNAAGSTFAASFSADTDTGLLDEDLLEMGLIWRFKAAKRFDFAAELAEYEIERDRRFALDAGTTRVFMARRRFILPPANVPETGFGA
ncbi:MAG: hypothetical protein ACR2RA_04970 [Geminicoccaceae bacterium]